MYDPIAHWILLCFDSLHLLQTHRTIWSKVQLWSKCLWGVYVGRLVVLLFSRPCCHCTTFTYWIDNSSLNTALFWTATLCYWYKRWFGARCKWGESVCDLFMVVILSILSVREQWFGTATVLRRLFRGTNWLKLIQPSDKHGHDTHLYRYCNGGGS